VALPCTQKNILRQKKNYGNSNISPCKSIIFQKSSKRNQNPSRYYNSITNLKFQHKPKHHLSKNPQIKINLLPRGQKSLKLVYSIMDLNAISLPGRQGPKKLGPPAECILPHLIGCKFFFGLHVFFVVFGLS